jgi:hypothetical protein
MRNNKVRLANNFFPKEQDVDIQGTFPPAALLPAVSAVGGFYSLERGQQFSRTATITACYGGVTKVTLIGHPHRSGGIQRGKAGAFQQTA